MVQLCKQKKKEQAIVFINFEKTPKVLICSLCLSLPTCKTQASHYELKPDRKYSNRHKDAQPQKDHLLMGPNGFNSCAFKAAFLWDKQRTTKSQTPHFKSLVNSTGNKTLCLQCQLDSKRGRGWGEP